MGKLLRINPLKSGTQPYSVPSTNPFVGKRGLDEIWAFGFRNPWRCGFDRSNGDLWCGDVGQAKYEEIDHMTDASSKGKNFGWRLLEGFHYYNWPGNTSGDVCTFNCRTLPLTEYAHSAFGGGNCAILGGYVSRRAGAPSGRQLPVWRLLLRQHLDDPGRLQPGRNVAITRGQLRLRYQLLWRRVGRQDLRLRLQQRCRLQRDQQLVLEACPQPSAGNSSPNKNAIPTNRLKKPATMPIAI